MSVKFSELPAASSAQTSDIFAITDSGVSRRLTAEQLLALVQSENPMLGSSVLPPNNDLNDAEETGVYHTDGSTLNGPGANRIILHLQRGFTDRAAQIAFSGAATSLLEIQWRELSGDGWSSWVEVTTSASDAATVRTTFGLEIGADVQAHGDVLDDLTTLGAASSDGEFIVADGAGSFAYESGATARASLGLTIGTDVQAHGDVLDDLNALGAPTTDGEFLVATGAGAFAYESGATARASLGLSTALTSSSGVVALNGCEFSMEVVTLADDTAATLAPPGVTGFVTVACHLNSNFSGAAFYDLDGTPTLSELTSAATGFDFVDGSTYTGTDGVDGNVSLCADVSTLTLENRSGGSRTFYIFYAGRP